ncbi:MAG TPA: signal peptidase II [Coxiellaceae bacterium]|nr:signal peptidase II [Coxiellaceae bacterium]
MKTVQWSSLKWLGMSVLVIALDQWSKFETAHHLYPGEPKVLLPFFNLFLTHNSGIAFSFFNTPGPLRALMIFGLPLVIVFVLIIWLLRSAPSACLQKVCIALIIGGATGNLIDRFLLGYVIDFFDFHIGAWHFATFNVADSAISIGAILVILRSFCVNRDV